MSHNVVEMQISGWKCVLHYFPLGNWEKIKHGSFSFLFKRKRSTFTNSVNTDKEKRRKKTWSEWFDMLGKINLGMNKAGKSKKGKRVWNPMERQTSIWGF